MILDAVHNFWGRPVAERIEFVVGPPQLRPAQETVQPSRRKPVNSPLPSFVVRTGEEPIDEVFARSAAKYFARR
jgi:hypothetical protein